MHPAVLFRVPAADMWLRGLISVRSFFNLTEATARRCAWGVGVITCSAYIPVAGCSVPVPAESTLYWRPEGSVTTPSFSLFAARNARPAFRSGDVRDVVAMTIAPTSRKKSRYHLVHTQSSCL